jgi:hypothetical protein
MKAMHLDHEKIDTRNQVRQVLFIRAHVYSLPGNPPANTQSFKSPQETRKQANPPGTAKAPLPSSRQQQQQQT